MSVGQEAALGRVLQFDRESVRLVADEVRAIPEGWVARTPSLRWVYSLNHVRVNEPIEAAEALALLERHMGEMPYRHLVVGHEASGERLAAELRPGGWEIERDVFMTLTGDVDRDLDTSAVVEVAEEEIVGLMTRWVGEDEDCRGQPEMIRQVVEASRQTWRARNARHFAVRGPDGSATGMTSLFSAESVAQVEDVYVVSEARGHGFGRALVTEAARQAVDGRHEVTFVPADDEDWPKELYADVGFEPVARIWVAHRRASA